MMWKKQERFLHTEEEECGCWRCWAAACLNMASNSKIQSSNSKAPAQEILLLPVGLSVCLSVFWRYLNSPPSHLFLSAATSEETRPGTTQSQSRLQTDSESPKSCKFLDTVYNFTSCLSSNTLTRLLFVRTFVTRSNQVKAKFQQSLMMMCVRSEEVQIVKGRSKGRCQGVKTNSSERCKGCWFNSPRPLSDRLKVRDTRNQRQSPGGQRASGADGVKGS